MNKWMFWIYCFLPFYGWSEMTSSSTELNRIEKDIQVLKDRLHQEQLKEVKEEVKGQELMIADWNAYAQELELIHRQQEENKQIQIQIQKLEERKAYLIKQPTKINVDK